MITPPSSPDQNAPVHPVDSFSENLQIFWLKNQNAILLGCGIVLAGILGRGLYQFYIEQHEASIAKAYAAASVSTEKLKQFAADHEGHALGGTAFLRVADEAYAAGKYDEAQAAYGKALASFKGSPFGARAQVGAAMSVLLSGKTSEGLAALKKIADDTNQYKGLRTQACYQLASLAAQAGNSDEVKKYTDQLLQIDSTSSWAQFALMLRSKQPAAAAKSGTGVTLGAPAK
jgi:predicted negative regulator of RcsB-dependent stress response